VEGNAPLFADDPMMLDIIPGVEIPINAINPGNASNMAMGISGQVNYKVNPKTSILARAGRTSFDLTNSNFLKGKTTITPVMVGAKYFPVDGLYVGAEAGANFVKTKIQTDFLIDITVASEEETLLSFGPTVGYELNLGGAKIDIGGHYHFVSNQFNYAGIKAGFLLPYGK